MSDMPQEQGGPRGQRVGESMREHAVLIVSPADGDGERVASMLSPLVAHIDRSYTQAEALEQIERLWYDAVIVDAGLDTEAALCVCEKLNAGRGGPSVVLYCERASLDLATRAMRLGVCDLLSPECSRLEFCGRVRVAIESGDARRNAAGREASLKRLCSKLDRAQREVSGQVGELCTDLAGAYQDLTEQIGELATVGELGGILRQELDVESLLRTFLEYLLGHVGSTNAGVFLPNSVGDFSLGAYINYDRPRATAEGALDGLAGVIAPEFEDDRRVVHLTNDLEITDRLGGEAGVFFGETVLAVACHDRADDPDSECLAVICLFRDRNDSFPAKALRTLQVASELFGQQMARVIRVHHRHEPSEIWGDDDIDLAA